MAAGYEGPGRGGMTNRPEEIYLARSLKKIDIKRVLYIFLGLALFFIIYFSPPWPDAALAGNSYPLTRAAKGAIALFCLAAVWWAFEVVPIGVTAVIVGIIQALLLLRGPDKSVNALTDFFDPSVWFILCSLIIGMAFTKSGLTQRMAYKMLGIVGERTSMIYLGSFIMIAILTLVMAHTAVAATIFPLLMAINSLYSEDEKPTKFGKGLFIGMAFACGAGSIVTLLGSARAPVATSFFKRFTATPQDPGIEISFFDLPYYMIPLACSMIIVIWLYMMIYFKPEKKTIPGLAERAKALYSKLGRWSKNEILTLAIVTFAIAVLGLKEYFPAMKFVDKSAILLTSVALFFFTNILTINDLEELPWNIVLLFGGSMSLGICIYETGAAQWMGIELLGLVRIMPGITFVLATALFVLITTNYILNVAVIALSLPVALAISGHLGISSNLIFFSILATSGMPFLTLIGASPNAIAYGSGQFRSREFLRAGIPVSIMLMILLWLFIRLIWPAMGMH